MVTNTQVVINGAGPTGLSLAIQLLRYNISFVIIDKKEGITTLSKAIAVQARTLEIFKEVGLDQEAIAQGQITPRMNLFHKGKRKASVNVSGFGEGLTEYPFILSLEQSKTEKLLVDYLTAKGVDIYWKTEWVSFDQNEQEVTVYCKDENGIGKSIKAAYLVGCDGAGSPIRHQLGLTYEGDTLAKIFYVADVIMDSPVINKNELYIYLIRKGFILFFPMEGTAHYRIIGIIPDKSEADPDLTFPEIESYIKQEVVSPVTFKKVKWFSTYKVHSRMANAFCKGRCFIAGDAAHIHTPAGGQGMNTGIQDAYNLGWKIALTLQGTLNSHVLDTYHTERNNNARHLLQSTDKMFDFMAGMNPVFNFIRLHLFPLIAGFMFNRVSGKSIFKLVSQIGIAYPQSFLTATSSVGRARAGDRMPYLQFSNGKTIFDYLTQPAFKLLYFGSGPTNHLNAFGTLKISVIIHSFTEIPANIFGNQKDFYLLLRPDNHIIYIAKDHQAIAALLQKMVATEK